MTCPQRRQIEAIPALLMFAILALALSMPLKTVSAENAFIQPSVLHSQSQNWLQDSARESYIQGTLPNNYTSFQDDAQPAAPAPAARSSRSRSRRSGSGRSLEIGGPFISTRGLSFWNDDWLIDGNAEFPVLGRMNVVEHNSPLPRDRAYLIYKNYQNVLNNSLEDFSGTPLGNSTRSVDQFLFGFEKTFHDEWSSLELRMPFFGTGSTNFSRGLATNDPSIGNFGVIGKRLLYRDELSAACIGCGVTVPTGDDTVISVADQIFHFQNNAVHVIPFLGWYKQAPTRDWYTMAFATLDIPTRGNQAKFVDPGTGTQNLGRLTDQTLLYLDVMLGRWIYRNPQSRGVTGISVQGELHYAGTVNDADSLSGVVSGVGWNTGYEFGSPRGRFDSTNAAIVLHTELKNNTDIRVAGLFPLSDSDNRFFDSEVLVVVVRRF